MQGESSRTEKTRAQLREKLAEHVGKATGLGTVRKHPASEFYVFLSYDLVDATRYKEVDPQRWPLVISRFYELITKSAEKELGPVRLWKLVGDEVLLHKQIRSIHDLRGCVPRAHAVLIDTVNRIHREFALTKSEMSIKGAIWCARVHDVPPGELGEAMSNFSSSGHRNIVISQLVGTDFPEIGQVDFLGPEVDAGFRIREHVTKRRLVVSADLAYLLYRDRANCEPIEHQLKMVSLEILKGIWGGRRYPIIWYEPEWGRGMFEYDERFNSEIVKHIEAGREPRSLSELPGIYRDLNKVPEADSLFDYVNGLRVTDDSDERASIVAAAQGPQLEVHCAAVCFRRRDGYALLARRRKTKRRLPGRWEFGCGQLAPNDDFRSALVRAYREDFGIAISFPCGLHPIRTYTIEDEEIRQNIPGIIFVAEIADSDDPKPLRHEEIRWADPDDPQDLPPEEDCVQDLRESLNRAFEVWRRTSGTPS
jgi:8-oxo-dGTP pyrophosphatase MutT (NUDIX family)